MAKTTPSKGPRPAAKKARAGKPGANVPSKGGRPPHVPTDQQRKQVEAMAAIGVRQDHLARIIGIGETTLREHYADELSLGGSKMVATIGNSLFAKALANGPQAVAACIFILKARAGWSEKQIHEHSGPGGGPIRHLDLTGLDEAELMQLDALLAKSAEAEQAQRAQAQLGPPR